MADYKRMVSYMYQYENGVKKKNVGFARVESKDGQCKITLHMQLLGQLDSIFPTYIMQRKHSDLELIYLGDTQLRNQVMDSKLMTEESNMMDSGYSLSDMGGLLLFLNDNIFFATEWDDKPVVAREVLDALKPKSAQETKVELNLKMEQKSESEQIPEVSAASGIVTEQALTLEEELLIPKYKLPRGYKTIERLQRPTDYIRVSYPKYMVGKETLEAMNQSEKERTVTEGIHTEEEAQVLDLIDGMEQSGIEEDPGVKGEEENFEAQELTSEAVASGIASASVAEDEEAVDPQVVKNIFEKFPRIYPFEDNEILLCAKIEPKDIGLLPKELWALSNNSFLVHGYYCYHHLIFAKLKDRYGCRYILGIPGIYHNRERFMAKMFGFDNFKPIRKRELRQGDFGYWYMAVNF